MAAQLPLNHPAPYLRSSTRRALEETRGNAQWTLLEAVASSGAGLEMIRPIGRVSFREFPHAVRARGTSDVGTVATHHRVAATGKALRCSMLARLASG